MEISVPHRLLDAGKKNKLMIMMQIVRVMTRMTVLLKVNLERRHLLLSQRKKNQITKKKKRDIKRMVKKQRISCFYLAIVAKKPMKNYSV